MRHVNTQSSQDFDSVHQEWNSMFHGYHGPCIHSSWPYLPFWGKNEPHSVCVCLVHANVVNTVCIVAASVVCNLFFLTICANVFNHFIWEMHYFYNKTIYIVMKELIHEEGLTWNSFFTRYAFDISALFLLALWWVTWWINCMTFAVKVKLMVIHFMKSTLLR